MRGTTGLSFTLAALLLVLLFPAYGTWAATFVVNSEADSDDILPGDGICSDNSNPDSSRCTLRAAIEECDALPGADTVVISGDTISIYLNLGPLILSSGGTVIVGTGGWPVIDGVANPFNTDMLVIESDSNIVRGVVIRRSRHHGIYVSGSHNSLGGEEDSERVVVVGNGATDSSSFAIAISGGTFNTVSGCWVGIYGNGADVYGNQNGVLVTDSAYANTVARCIVSGNAGYGVVISSRSHGTTLLSNWIGPDITGKSGPGNGSAGVLIAGGAYDNYVGDGSADGRNVIAANARDGIEISGMFTDGNRVSGNYVGVDITGAYSLANQGNGISIRDGASSNLIGDTTGSGQNIISGNVGDGIRIAGAGTEFNFVAANYVGPSVYGGGTIGGDKTNTNGVAISDGARENTVGGMTAAGRNLISANTDVGVLITGQGTSDNRVTGNFVGVSKYGISSVPNGSGVVIQDGASDNIIGGPLPGQRNIISGNRADVFPYGGGVLIYGSGTNYNVVQGNYIGTDTAGTRALRNGSAGVIIGSGAKYNQIGGSASGEGNIISGNGWGDYSPTLARGVHIYGEGTDFNRISGNLIGLSSVDSLAVPNAGHGVGIAEGARYTIVGGTSSGDGNVIAGNEGFGLFISGATTERNTARYNNYIDNDSTAIVIRGGAQGGITPPSPSLATTNDLFGSGAQPRAMVDAYLTWSQAGGFYEGTMYLGSARVSATGSYRALLPTLSIGDSVAAIITDTLGNSSAFSPGVIVSMYSDVSDTSSALPFTFDLKQNYPNPFNPSTRIEFSLPGSSQVYLAILNVLGQEVAVLYNGRLSSGEHAVEWDGTDRTGESVASGVYFYRLTSGSLTATRKMLLLK